MLLVVGLGNPGAKYANNRHNIGFMAVDEIVRRYSFSNFRAKFQGEVAEGNIDGERILALKPKTYMNESGRSVHEAMVFSRSVVEPIHPTRRLARHCRHAIVGRASAVADTESVRLRL